MENEIIEMVEMDDVIVADEGKGLGTGAAMLIGAGIAFAIGAGVKLTKMGINYFKAKKAEREAAAEHDFCTEPDKNEK